MKRPLWKLPFIHHVFFKKRTFFRNFEKLFLRNSLIPYYCLNKIVNVYNGIWFLKVEITKYKIGHKFGEFAFTKCYDGQLKVKRKSKKKSKK